ncbi:putative protein EARLY FLOWERING 4 [Helianthus annuus]|nr:putative protein EARLY FLOWERING 4 [Helianthus annuus]
MLPDFQVSHCVSAYLSSKQTEKIGKRSPTDRPQLTEVKVILFVMEGNGGGELDGKVLQTFQKSFVQVQNILDQNRLLINEINQNHESKVPDNLSRNVGLIRELNNNIKKVVHLYSDLSSNFSKSVDVNSSEGDSRSDAKKRTRPPTA